MNLHDDLDRTLAENGVFDHEKAAVLAASAVGEFESKMRKVERYLFGYLCGCTWLIVFTGLHFLYSTTTKSQLLYGLLLLVFFETTVLMKLWYWVVNSKISTLKAIKQLELTQTSSSLPAKPNVGVPSRQPLVGLSRRERTAWWAVMIGVAALIGAVKGADPSWGSGTSLTSEGRVVLAADGGSTSTTDLSFLNQGLTSRKRFNYYAPESVDVQFTDGRGRELPFSTMAQNGHTRYDIKLLDSVKPGQRVTYRRSQTTSGSATLAGDVWTFSTDYSYGHDTIEFSETVILPEGAEIVSVSPWPNVSYVLQDRQVVRFEATRGRREPFQYRIQYRFMASTGDEGA